MRNIEQYVVYYCILESISLISFFVACVLFPFMAFMVEDFGYTGSELGRYVGLLAAAFCGAQFFSSVLWGKVSDIYGRKPAILIGTFGTIFGMLIFGMAKTYTQAVIGRVIAGLLSGNIGVMKTYVVEITDDTNRGTGFSYMSVSWAIGSVVAPMFGGLFSNPCTKYPSVFGGITLFETFPYLLPCLLCVILLAFSVVICALYMRETRVFKSAGAEQAAGQSKGSKQAAVGEETQNFIHKKTHASGEIEMRHVKPAIKRAKGQDYEAVLVEEDEERDEEKRGEAVDKEEEEEEEDVEVVLFDNSISSSSLSEDANVELGKVSAGKDEDLGEEEEEEIEEEDADCQCFMCGSGSMATSDLSMKGTTVASRPQSRGPLFKRNVILSCANYGVLCMAFILFDETLPLFLKLDVSQSGFSFDSMSIGLLLSAAGVFMIFFAYYILPVMSKGSKTVMFRRAISVTIAHVLLWPLLGQVHNWFLLEPVDQQVLDTCIYYPLMFCLLITKTISATFAFMAVNIQIGHSVFDEDLGTVNGFGQSLGAMARGIGPAIGGVMWSVSMSVHIIYLNYLLMLLMLGLNLYIGSLLPASLDFQKKRKGDHKASDPLPTDGELVLEF